MSDSRSFPNRFAGKTMIVTGAGQGIGAAVALRAAAEGARVLLADRAEVVSTVSDQIIAAGGTASHILADLEHHAEAERVMAEAIRLWNRIDILINNVGGAIRMRPLAQFEPEQIDAEIRRSLMPTLYCCHAVLPFMLAQQAGTIVNVSSNATRGIHRVPYSAAKGGINAVTQSLAMELAPSGIRVVATAPGGTSVPERPVPRNPDGDTLEEQRWTQEAVEQVIQSTFVKRYASIAEQAAPILFLASDEASYITGNVLPVAGGDLG
jgi:dihydroxycyclohexadiene carboxylate dehydrogenase